MNGKAQLPRTAIPRVASLAVDPDRLPRILAMTPQERQHAAQSGQLPLSEMLKWASRHPGEVEPIDGEL